MLSSIQKCIFTSQAENMSLVLIQDEPDQFISQQMEIMRQQLILFIKKEMKSIVNLYTDEQTGDTYTIDIIYILNKILNIVCQYEIKIQLYIKKEDLDLLLNLFQYAYTLDDDSSNIFQLINQLLYYITYNSQQFAIQFNLNKFIQLVKKSNYIILNDVFILQYVLLIIHNTIIDAGSLNQLVWDDIFSMLCIQTVTYTQENSDFTILDNLCSLINLMVNDLMQNQLNYEYSVLYQKIQNFLLQQIIQPSIQAPKNQLFQQSIDYLSVIYSSHLLYTSEQIIQLVSYSDYFYILCNRKDSKQQIIQFLFYAKSLKFTSDQLAVIDEHLQKIILQLNFNNSYDLFALYASQELQMNEYIQEHFLEWLINLKSQFHDIVLVIKTLTKMIAMVQNSNYDTKYLYKVHIQNILSKIKNELNIVKIDQTEENCRAIYHFCIEITFTYDDLITNQDIDFFILILKQFNLHAQKQVIKQLTNIIKERDQDVYI